MYYLFLLNTAMSCTFVYLRVFYERMVKIMLKTHFNHITKSNKYLYHI